MRSFRNGMPKLKASLKKKPVRGRPSAFQVCTMVDPRNAHTVVDFLVHFLGDARNASVFALLFRQTKPTNFRQARTLPKSSVNSNRYSAYAYNSHEIKNSEILYRYKVGYITFKYSFPSISQSSSKYKTIRNVE